MSNKNLLDSNTIFFAKNSSRIGLIAVIYMTIAAVCYHFIEGWSWLNSFYFVVVTMATVGYGDLTPQTRMGRLFTIFFIIFGIAIFSAAIANISHRARERREAKIQTRSSKE